MPSLCIWWSLAAVGILASGVAMMRGGKPSRSGVCRCDGQRTAVAIVKTMWTNFGSLFPGSGVYPDTRAPFACAMHRMPLNEHDANQGRSRKASSLDDGQHRLVSARIAEQTILMVILLWGVSAFRCSCACYGRRLACSLYICVRAEDDRPEHYDTDFSSRPH